MCGIWPAMASELLGWDWWVLRADGCCGHTCDGEFYRRQGTVGTAWRWVLQEDRALWAPRDSECYRKTGHCGHHVMVSATGRWLLWAHVWLSVPRKTSCCRHTCDCEFSRKTSCCEHTCHFHSCSFRSLAVHKVTASRKEGTIRIGSHKVLKVRALNLFGKWETGKISKHQIRSNNKF